MNQPFIKITGVLAVLALLLMGVEGSPALAAQDSSTANENGVDVLTYGPIHEAFGETVQFDPEPGVIVPKAPPKAINEIPPEQRPEGDVEWIPGYWAWDDDRADFIWVSGIWRVIPPDRQWVSGYWLKTRQGYQWVSGYWEKEEATDTEYLPEPPESVEVGPNVGAPSPDHTWIPGSWVWYGGRYAWRPGYWAPVKTNWIWVPAHYVWTPRGYIFVGGYWDFAVTRRGVVFAPIYFSLGVAMRPGFYFTPTFIVDLRVFSDLLFINPRYHHYYFGDYYAPKYYRRGIYPWFSPHAMRRGYDPIYAHQRWKNRHNRGWENRLQAKYQERRKYVGARPPRKLYAPGTPVRKVNPSKTGARKFASSFPPVKKIEKSPPKFHSLSEKERTKIHQRGKEMTIYTNKRQKLETQKPAKPIATISGNAEPNRVKLPRSPIAAKPNYGAGTKNSSPTRYEAPRLDPNVEPLQRKPYHFSGKGTAEMPNQLGHGKTFNEKQPKGKAHGSNKR